MDQWLGKCVICLAVSGVFSSKLPYDRVDLIELNHRLTDTHEQSYRQIILWEWSPDYRRFEVVAWWLLQEQTPHLPVRLKNGQWSITWCDSNRKAMREARANHFRETTTHYDPERMNALLVADSQRAMLINKELK